VQSWSAEAETAIGAIVPAIDLWGLAQHWFDGRLALDWKPRPPEASQQLLTDAGFEGEFWSLAG
jgi:hypothetical protein